MVAPRALLRQHPETQDEPHEFAETGTNERLGYESPADLVDQYPSFFWRTVEPYIGDALRYLERTIEGKQWISCLYSHVFSVEHGRRVIGPQLGRGCREPGLEL